MQVQCKSKPSPIWPDQNRIHIELKTLLHSTHAKEISNCNETSPYPLLNVLLMDYKIDELDIP
jgi:hypothetical protein